MHTHTCPFVAVDRHNVSGIVCQMRGNVHDKLKQLRSKNSSKNKPLIEHKPTPHINLVHIKTQSSYSPSPPIAQSSYKPSPYNPNPHIPS